MVKQNRRNAQSISFWFEDTVGIAAADDAEPSDILKLVKKHLFDITQASDNRIKS
jgi:hypothetical protein